MYNAALWEVADRTDSEVTCTHLWIDRKYKLMSRVTMLFNYHEKPDFRLVSHPERGPLRGSWHEADQERSGSSCSCARLRWQWQPSWAARASCCRACGPWPAVWPGGVWAKASRAHASSSGSPHHPTHAASEAHGKDNLINNKKKKFAFK